MQADTPVSTEHLVLKMQKFQHLHSKSEAVIDYSVAVDRSRSAQSRLVLRAQFLAQHRMHGVGETVCSYREKKPIRSLFHSKRWLIPHRVELHVHHRGESIRGRNVDHLELQGLPTEALRRA